MPTKDEFEQMVLTGPTLDYERIWADKRITFDIMPKNFLRFAENALSQNSESGLINALSNTKRALDCQVELIIYEHGFGKKLNKERWGFPKKIKFLQENGILAPRILEKINKTRNLLEHEFKKPDIEHVEDALDVVTLFIGYSERIHRVPDCIRLGFDESTTKSFAVTFIKDDPRFDVVDGSTVMFSITENDKSFGRLLKLFYGTQPATYTLMHKTEIQDINY